MPFNTRFLGPTPLTNSNSIGSAVIAGLMSHLPLYIRYISPNCPLAWGIYLDPYLTRIISWFLGVSHQTHHSIRHLDWISRFSTIHGRYQRTDRKTERRQNSTGKNGPPTLYYGRRSLIINSRPYTHICTDEWLNKT